MSATDRPVYIVLGATGGVGSATSRRLATHGARLVVAGRNADAVHGLAVELEAEPFPLDATDPEAVAACFAHAHSAHGRLDGAVNCVGSLLLKPAHTTTQDEFHHTVMTNLGSAFATVAAAGKTMKRAGGSIVLLSSAAAEVGLVNHEAIAAAKAGVIGLARAASATYAGRAIRVNCVAPGMVRTPLTQAITSSELAMKGSVALHALGRIGEPEEIAAAIAFLLHPENSWITGQVLGVDGGLARVRSRVRA